ncbi:MAG TPA: HD domain-containing phosphohydrolase [Gemmatimonadales bacterium]|nr:HD domain-containing phosphohydrolase [Gemmatimonadales bacterium]
MGRRAPGLGRFSWDIKPIIRWHHEKYDGTGYPDRLAGDQIPIGTQIIGIVDVDDALTTTRSYRPALAAAEAVSRIVDSRTAWRDGILRSFMSSVGKAA